MMPNTNACGFKTSTCVPVVKLSSVWITSRKLGLGGRERKLQKVPLVVQLTGGFIPKVSDQH